MVYEYWRPVLPGTEHVSVTVMYFDPKLARMTESWVLRGSRVRRALTLAAAPQVVHSRASSPLFDDSYVHQRAPRH